MKKCIKNALKDLKEVLKESEEIQMMVVNHIRNAGKDALTNWDRMDVRMDGVIEELKKVSGADFRSISAEN